MLSEGVCKRRVERRVEVFHEFAHVIERYFIILGFYSWLELMGLLFFVALVAQIEGDTVYILLGDLKLLF